MLAVISGVYRKSSGKGTGMEKPGKYISIDSFKRKFLQDTCEGKEFLGDMSQSAAGGLAHFVFYVKADTVD